MTARLVSAIAILAMSLDAQEMVEGTAGSAVRVLVYEDLQCPDCAGFREMLDAKLLPRYADKVAFVHRDFPLAKHAWARPAAIAARFFSSRDAKLGMDFRRETMANLRDINAGNFNEKLAGYARRHGIDPAEALAALSDAKLAAAVEKDFQDGVARGIARTPTVLVNGKPFIETFTFEEISKEIEQALAETK
jgi:protein-disulfide isomerase